MRTKLIVSSAMMLALTACGAKPTDGLGLSSLAKLGTVDERYQAYNVEMVEVTGGRFWAPYGGPANERYRQRPPIDLTDPKLVALAKGLGPSLMRVSGTWSTTPTLRLRGKSSRPRRKGTGKS